MENSILRNNLSTVKQTLTSVNEDELVSDFLESVKLSDDTVQYCGAQVAVESTSATSKTEKLTTPKQADPKRLTAAKCLEFSVKRPEDKENVNVHGIVCVSTKVVVVCDEKKVLKLFDESGTYISSTELEYSTFGITYIHDSMFATCGRNTVHLWTLCGQKIVREDVSYHVDLRANGIHYNGTYYCVLHRTYNAITILDSKGSQMRKIIMQIAFGQKFKFGFDIHMDRDTNNIYVPCFREDGVVCFSVEGQALWFTSLSDTWGITEIHGSLCVAYVGGTCLSMITKEGEYIRKLLDKRDLGGKPTYVCYGQNDRLYVSYSLLCNQRENISVFRVA